MDKRRKTYLRFGDHDLYKTHKGIVIEDMVNKTSYLSGWCNNPSTDYHKFYYYNGTSENISGVEYRHLLIDECTDFVVYPKENPLAEHFVTFDIELKEEMLYAEKNGLKVFIINPETFDMERIDSVEEYLLKFKN